MSIWRESSKTVMVARIVEKKLNDAFCHMTSLSFVVE